MKLPPTVFVVDPDPQNAAALCGRIRKMGLAAETFADGHSLLKGLDPGRPGCVLAEMDLPDIEGVDLLHRLIESGCLLPMIFTSATADVAAIVPILRAGAVDFLPRPCDDLALWNSLQLAIERDNDHRGKRAFRADVTARLAELTNEERHVLHLLLENKPNRVIAARLDVSPRTVNFRRATLLKKLGVASVIELASLLTRAEYTVGSSKSRNTSSVKIGTDFLTNAIAGRRHTS